MTETGNENIRQAIGEIEAGRTALGIEFGSTRIKAVLIGSDHKPIASGGHDWENQLENGVWTYSLESVKLGLQDAYAKLVKDVADTYGVILHTVGAIGISAMMHGYLVFDEKDQLLVPYLAQHHDSGGIGEADRAVQLSGSTALEHRTSLSGHPEEGASCEEYPLHDDAGGLCSLAVDWTEGARHRRCGWYVPC